MRIFPFIVIAALTALATAASAHPNFPPGAEAQERRIMAHVGPHTRIWIATEAHRIAMVSSPDVNGDVLSAYPNLSSGDIAAMVFLVLMEVNREEETELEQEVAEMNALNNEKKAARNRTAGAETLRKAKQVLLTKSANNSAGAGDSGEIGEMTSARLQIAMERKSKMEETLSNLLKKLSDNGDAIIHNMK